MLCTAPAGYAMQAATGGAQSQSAPAPAPAITPSSLIQPSLDTLSQTVGALKVEKWKGGSVRTEAGTNIASIQKDLQTTLPGLLKEADAASGSMSKVLPVSRNFDALYDVVLRVVDGASVAAPGEQLAQLQQALISLSKARHAMDDRIADMAAAQEKHLGTLQAALKAQPAPVCPAVAAPVCPATTPAKKKVVKKKPATTTPSTTQPNSTQPNGAAKPN
jgi:hypothetical protein